MLDNKALDPIATLFVPVAEVLKFVVEPIEMFVRTFPPPVVISKLLIEPESEAVTDVAIIVPVPVIVGEVIAGDEAKTSAPLPVSPVTAAAKLADDGVAKNVATLVPNPDTPVDIGKQVAFVKILPAATVPRTGVTRVGDVANTFKPVPVLSVNAVSKLADDGVPKNVATLAAKPDTPVEIGKQVAFVKILPAATVPRTGVTRVGDVARTTVLPVPVTAVIPVVLILRTLPVSAVSKVLFVNVSVVALPTKVSLLVAGNIKVFVPAVAVAQTVVVPEVSPLNFTLVPFIESVTVKEPVINVDPVI